MPFNFLHRPTRKKGRSRPWYENALLLAVAGSIIAVVGQLGGTVIPLKYGPTDISDFSISVSPVSTYMDLNKTEPCYSCFFKLQQFIS